MARPDINRSGELEVFVRVIETGGFSAAARTLDMTPSAVSKLVARLEQRLGTRLLQRSTRQLQLTPEGCAFYERGLRVLADLEEAERCASAQPTQHQLAQRIAVAGARVATGQQHAFAPVLQQRPALHRARMADIQPVVRLQLLGSAWQPVPLRVGRCSHDLAGEALQAFVSTTQLFHFGVHALALRAQLVHRHTVLAGPVVQAAEATLVLLELFRVGV